MDLNDIMKMLKDPAALQKQAMEAQSRMASISATGSSGGGMVKMTMNGTMELLNIAIAPEAIDPADPSILEDLIKAAYNDVSHRIREAIQADVSRNMGGLSGFGS